MKTKITQLSILLIALFFMNANAQSGDFEFLFNTDADLEGWTSWNGGALAVSGGVLTYTYSGSNTGMELNPPATAIDINETANPYIAIKLSSEPERMNFFCNIGWYKETTIGGVSNYVVDAELNAANVFYFDFFSQYDSPLKDLPDGAVTRIIYRLQHATAASVDIEWIKTFASREAIAAYAGVTLSADEFSKSQISILSGDNKIKVNRCELNSKIQVFDLLGKRVKSLITKSNEVDINLNTEGVYIVKVEDTSGSVFTKKAIVY